MKGVTIHCLLLRVQQAMHPVPTHAIFLLEAMMSPEVKKWSSKLKHHLVDVTPAPVLSRLKGLDNRVIGRVEMFGGVLILRRVTAANMPAFETEAQVHPTITDFQAIFAPIGAWRDLSYLVEMTTLLCHVSMLSFLWI